MDNGKITKEEDNSGGALQKLAGSAFLDSVSSLSGSAVVQGAKRLNDFSKSVCRANLDRMAKEQSVVAAVEVENVAGGVSMSPIIKAMLEGCFLSLGGGGGNATTWVVCAPTDQGKTVAAQFLIHGNHTLRPKRSLKIDATDMTNFAKDFAEYLQCSAAESCMSQLLCEALNDTAPRGDDSKDAKASAAAMNVTGKYLCAPGKAIASENLMQMRDAEKYKLLKLETDNNEPAPILIIDEFYCDTEENQKICADVATRCSGKRNNCVSHDTRPSLGVQVIKLNGGTKCKPLHRNVDNQEYDGSKRFTESPVWNEFFWPVKDLRELVRPKCEKFNITPETAVPDDAKLTAAEAKKTVMKLRLKKQLS